jgi:hypothetical protein
MANLKTGGYTHENTWKELEIQVSKLDNDHEVVVEIWSDEKPSDTQRSGELRFYFTPAIPDELTLKILGPQQ